MALRIAEAAGVKVATATGSAVIPIATPIANRVAGGWATVDAMACRWLDNVEKAVPIITKPPDEIVNDTRNYVITSLAGQPLTVEQTLKAALTARASGMVVRASSTEYGRVIADMADSLLYSAHVAVDTYLPHEDGDLHHSDGTESSLGTKAYALASKTQARLRRNAKHQFEKYEDSNEDEDEVIIYPLHLNENGDHFDSPGNAKVNGNTYTKTAIKMVSKGGELFSNVFSLVTHTVGMGYGVLEYGMNTANSMMTTEAGVTFSIVLTSAGTAYSICSHALNVANTCLIETVDRAKLITTNGAGKVQEALNCAMNMIQTAGIVAIGVINNVKFLAIDSLTVVQDTGIRIVQKLSLMVPTPFTKLVDSSQKQLLSMRGSISSNGFYKTSKQALELPRRVPQNTFLLLKDNYVLIHVQLWVVDFQRRLTAFVQNGAPKENEKVQSEQYKTLEAKEAVKLLASALN